MGTIAKITVDGSTHLLASTAYAICSTEANIAEKTAVIQENNEFILFTGVTVHIKFTASNSADVPTLNINGTGAYPIKQYGTTSVGNTEDTSWKAGATLSVTFDGNYWQLNGASSTGSEYTNEEKTKLAGIESGAEVNVQSDWNQTDTSSDSFIKNKPTINGKSLSGNTTLNASEIVGYTNAQTQQDVSVSSWIQNLEHDIYQAEQDVQSIQSSKVDDVKVNGVSVVNSNREALINLTADKIEFRAGGSSTIPHWEDAETVDVALDMIGQAFPANDFTDAYKTKLDGIESGAEVNVNADWNATSGDAQILNKPEIPTSQTMQGYVDTVYEDLADLYESKSSVSWSQLVSSGVQIASINIDGNTVQVFAPTSGGGSSYTPTIRINGSDYSILRWEKTVLNNISGINFVYQDGSLESTAFVPDSEGISYIINQIPTQPSDIGALSSANLEMEMDSVDLKQLDIYFSTEGGSGHPSTSSNMIETTWANLVSLRDSGGLTKGAFYRITDYNFVTNKTGVQSGNHQFDIICLALSESMLSENAYAARHAGDTYFQREVSTGGIEWIYTLYVDDYAENYDSEPINHEDDLHNTDVFCASGTDTHPSTGEIVPVLYKTNSEEYGFDEPDYEDAYFYEGIYDLDGDEYDMWSKYEEDPDTGDLVFLHQYALTDIVVEDGEIVVSPTPETKMVPVNMNTWELKYTLDNDSSMFDWAFKEGKGVIYYMKDEFGNEAPYDFKNARFIRYQCSAVSNSSLNSFLNQYMIPSNGAYQLTRNNSSQYFYTFVSADDRSADGSLFGECTSNRIGTATVETKTGSKKVLNNIVLHNAINNTFGSECTNITCTSPYNSTFDALSDVCILGVAHTSFGAGCKSITLNGSSDNVFKGGNYNIYGATASNNEFAYAAREINLGINAVNNVFNTCYNITLGNYNTYNVFNVACANITTGIYCSYCTFGKNNTTIALGSYCRYINIGDACRSITINPSGGNHSNYVQYINIGTNIANLTIQPTRNLAYEQNWYKSGRTETAV